MEFIKRNYDFEITTDADERGNIIIGRPIVYNSRTDIGPFDEIIESGALDETNLKDVRFLVNHDMNKIPLARSRNNNANSTMQLSVDDNGMVIRVLLDTENNAEAKSLYSAVKRGDVSGMSFCFSVGGETWDDLTSEHPTRHITKIDNVVEVSAVTFPAYGDTTIDARSETLDNAKLTLENARAEFDASSLENENRQAELEAEARAIAEAESKAKEEAEIFKLKYLYGGKIS